MHIGADRKRHLLLQEGGSDRERGVLLGWGEETADDDHQSCVRGTAANDEKAQLSTVHSVQCRGMPGTKSM